MRVACPPLMSSWVVAGALYVITKGVVVGPCQAQHVPQVDLAGQLRSEIGFEIPDL